MVHHGEGLIRCASGASDREATMSGTRSRACLPTPWCGPLALTATVALAPTWCLMKSPWSVHEGVHEGGRLLGPSLGTSTSHSAPGLVRVRVS